jgi:hypothetical protein
MELSVGWRDTFRLTDETPIIITGAAVADDPVQKAMDRNGRHLWYATDTGAPERVTAGMPFGITRGRDVFIADFVALHRVGESITNRGRGTQVNLGGTHHGPARLVPVVKDTETDHHETHGGGRSNVICVLFVVKKERGVPVPA